MHTTKEIKKTEILRGFKASMDEQTDKTGVM